MRAQASGGRRVGDWVGEVTLAELRAALAEKYRIDEVLERNYRAFYEQVWRELINAVKEERISFATAAQGAG